MARSRATWRSVHLLLGFYLAGVAALMFVPVPSTPSSLPSYADKLVHVVVFVGLGAVWWWDRRAAGVTAVRGAIAASAAIAGLVEVVQALLPFRSGDLVDFAAGVLGAFVGAVAAAALGRRLPRPPHPDRAIEGDQGR